ncbi:hypothetical protein MKW98_018118, partial [Papaver atlanticum]
MMYCSRVVSFHVSAAPKHKLKVKGKIGSRLLLTVANFTVSSADGIHGDCTFTRSMWFVHFGFSAFSCTNWISSEDELKVIKEVVSTFSFGSDLTLRCYACNPRCCNTVQ